MLNNAIPVAIEDEEATTPACRQTMAELTSARLAELRLSYEEAEPICQVCADRGTMHTPEDDAYPEYP